MTIGAPMACLSSFYRFLIRMNVVAASPCDALERPRIQPSPPKGLSADEIRRLLAAVPETKAGLRDRTLILTLALTGRRPTEVTVPALSTRVTTVTFDEPGEVAYICHLPCHEAYGMVGTLRVVEE